MEKRFCGKKLQILFWKSISQHRAPRTISRRSRIELQNLLRLRLCREARTIARPRGARGDLDPRGGANLLFRTPLNLQKATQRKRWQFAKSTPLNLLSHERNPIVAQKNIPFYTIFPPFVLARFLQIEGGCEKANSHPLRGTKSPRAPRGRATARAP